MATPTPTFGAAFGCGGFLLRGRCAFGCGAVGGGLASGGGGGHGPPHNPEAVVGAVQAGQDRPTSGSFLFEQLCQARCARPRRRAGAQRVLPQPAVHLLILLVLVHGAGAGDEHDRHGAVAARQAEHADAVHAVQTRRGRPGQAGVDGGGGGLLPTGRGGVVAHSHADPVGGRLPRLLGRRHS
eukprot:scaffold1368_cov78-Isochrysis_galbana.AAC.1